MPGGKRHVKRCEIKGENFLYEWRKEFKRCNEKIPVFN